MKFWGKIEGTTKDYYLALALNFKGKYEFPSKAFFYANNDLQFKELPALMLEYAQEVENQRGFFTGTPSHVLVQVGSGAEGGEGGEDSGEKKEEEVQEEDSDDEAPKVVKRSFCEVDRLAYTVLAIENDCQTVPVGSVKLTCDHELRYNQSFQGIPSPRLAFFQHFR